MRVDGDRIPRLTGGTQFSGIENAVVVFDTCADGTEAISRRMGATTVVINALNVGIVTATGAQLALDAVARWLALTDADTLFAPNWIAAQIALRSDAVCRTVAVLDWG